jgi:hypothetical protein
MSSRSRRFTRLRTTAEPTARLTTKPTFGAASLGTGPTGKSSAPETTEPPTRRPERSVRRNSSELLIRVCLGSTTPPAQPWLPARLARWGLGQTASCSRPLRRRAASTARPARVRMRMRKPWTFARRRLFGWNVRLLTGTPETRCGVRGGHAVRRAVRTWPARSQAAPTDATGVSLLTVKAIGAQVKPSRSAPPSAARSPGYHHGTPRFPQRIRRRRLRLWKINVRRPTRWEPAAARERGKPRYSVRTHLVDGPVDNELRSVVDVTVIRALR